MKHSKSFSSKVSMLILLFSICFSTISVAKEMQLKLKQPIKNVQITENMPVLSWELLEGYSYEVWIDGINFESKIDKNWYIPFPLSYGKHEWKIVAVKGNSKITSQKSEFVIVGKPLSSVPKNSVLLRNNWKVISSAIESEDGSVISSEKVNTTSWKNSSVPATVLSVMVRNGLYPNPYTGLNNMKIPDCNDAFNEKYELLQYSHIQGKNPWKDAYWYRKEFEIPSNYKDKYIWLNLGEINYKAEVWLNGTQIADTLEVIGMEQLFKFDITKVAKTEGKNILAIAIYPPDHPGKPANAPITPLASPGTNMADGAISHDYTKWDVMGWDWQPAIRDRDMGITEDVFINATDAIELTNLYVTSNLPLPDTSFADVTVSADIKNHSDHQKEGKIEATISIGNEVVKIEQSFSVQPNGTFSFLWNNKNRAQLHFKNPKLWWPVGYGNPELYDLKIIAKTQTNEQSTKQIHFGIREIETYLGNKERVYKINGQDIYCKGGNWVIDMMLNWTAKRYEDEILLTKNSNLNMLRVWGPTGAPPEAFYDAADKHGILLWQDFLNDFWGTMRNRPGFRPEESIFEKASISIVKKYRNHPALIMWCGGNEGVNPREELILTKILPEYDGRDSKHYLKTSNGDGLHGGGPYHTLEPEKYFTDNKLNGFSSEIGPSGVPVFESVQKFMPNLGETWMPGRFPLDGVWAYHDANDWRGRDMRKFSFYDNIIRNYYGGTDSTLIDAEEYLEKCQLLNYDVYRASIEAINSQLWENSSGILLWKSNSSWPSITWQVYDWYLQAHAGYYGVKKAASPVVIQFNRASKKVEILNATYKVISRAKVTATLYNSNLDKIWETSENHDLPKSSVFTLKDSVPVTTEICYLKLKVENQKGDIISDNFYWLSSENNFKAFNNLPETKLKISTKKENSNELVKYNFSISNKGKTVALMTELRLVDNNTGLEILPSIWTDNYISLLPGEKKMVQVEINSNNLPTGLFLKYKTFNTKEPGMIKL